MARRILGYILDKKKNPVPVYDIAEWAKWFETSHKEKIVDQDTLPDGTFISTVFLGIDHQFGDSGSPILFETLVVNKKWEWKNDNPDPETGQGQLMWRYHTWAEAKKGHMKAIIKCLGDKATEYIKKYDQQNS